MKEWIKDPVVIIGLVVSGLISIFCLGVFIGTKQIDEPIPIDNTSQIDSLVNVISVKDGQIIQLEQDYSDLEQLKTQARVKYRDRIIKVRDGDVLVVFEELKENL